MSSTLTIALPKKEKERLTRLALNYGLSLPEFSRLVLQGMTSEIPVESLSEYENPRALKASLARAFRDWRRGRVKVSGR